MTTIHKLPPERYAELRKCYEEGKIAYGEALRTMASEENHQRKMPTGTSDGRGHTGKEVPEHYDIVVAHLAAHPGSTHREIMEAIGTLSKNRVSQILHVLRGRGTVVMKRTARRKGATSGRHEWSMVEGE